MMAAEGTVVRVTGLPVDIPENRLLDKIYIHFLRRKSGGGEITSVTLSKTTPGTAFITFEDSEVASRLAKQEKHIFRVNDKNFDVVVSLHHEPVHVDTILVHMSVTVDHSKLPEGKTTLLFLHRGFPGVHLTFDSHKHLCTLNGHYTEVQSLTCLLLGSADVQAPGDKPQSWTEGKEKSGLPRNTSAHSILGTGEMSELAKQPQQQAENLDVELHEASWKSAPLHQLSNSSHSEEKWNVEPESGACLEDFSFVVDSDIFRYLHKYCTKEYQSILRRYRVEVLDETCQDITTLYLKPKKGLSGRGMDPVQRAQQDLTQLYLEKSSQLRREQMSSIPEKGLEQVLETLRQRLPQLMIEEEKGTVCLVGSGSDVSEAKQFIIDVRGSMVDKAAHSNHPHTHSQSTFPLSKPIQSDLPVQLDIFQTLGNKCQDSDDLFKDVQKTIKDKWHNSNETKCNYGDLKSLGEHTHSSLLFQQPQTMVLNDDIFSVRNNDRPEEVLTELKRTEPSGWSDMEKFTNAHSLFSKSSFTLSTYNPDSEETWFKGLADTNSGNSEKQLRSAKGHKTKRESGRELKMAANFSREIFTGNSGDSRSATEPRKSDAEEEVMLEHERPPEGGQTRSLPFIKPAMNSNLKPNPIPSGVSGLSKTDILVPTGDVKKHGHIPFSCPEKPVLAYLTESQPFSPGHMGLCGDAGIVCPASTSGLALKRSNSFSGRIKTGQVEQTVVDMSALQKREIFTLDVPVSKKHWLYLKSVYSNEIDNLTSDLQVKENIRKEDIALSLRGADLEKVKECQCGLRALIAIVETDFDARTLPLSMFGVSDCKDKTLVDFCARMKRSYEKVRILVTSKLVMILGPRLICDEVEAAMIKIFHTEVSCAETQSGKPSNLPITADHVTLTSNSKPHPEYLTQTMEHAQVGKNNLHKMPDQSNASISEKVSADHSSDKKLKIIDQNNQDQSDRDQVDQGRTWKKVDRKQDAEERTGVGSALKLQIGEAGTSSKESTKDDNLVFTLRRNEEDENISEEHRMKPDLQKKREIEANAQKRETFTEQGDRSSVSQAGGVLAPPGGPVYLSTGVTSRVGGNEDCPLRCECLAQCSTANCPECGMGLQSERQKEECADGKHSPLGAQQDTWRSRGSMSIRESTITIPGFLRDTTLRIIYEIPDGIQGESDPCPGAPFKGDRFEAFLPLNEATKKLLPMLKRAFHRGLTFSIRAEPPERQGLDRVGEGRVVWGSVPHKTRIDGGASKNGYPDSTYIRRLTQTLKASGLEESQDISENGGAL